MYKKSIYNNYKQYNNEYIVLSKLIQIYKSITKDISSLQREKDFLLKGDITYKVINKLHILINCVDEDNSESGRFISLYLFIIEKLKNFNKIDNLEQTHPMYQELIELMTSLTNSMSDELKNI